VHSERQAVAITDRPLRVIDLIDGAFAALRYRPRVLFVSILWIVVPMALLEGWISRDILGGGGIIGLLNDPTLFEEAAEQGTSQSTTVFAYLIDWLRISLIGVSTAFLIDRWGEGEDPGVADVMRFTLRRSPAWLATFVLAKLAIGFGLLLIIPGVAFALAFTLASPILAIERTGPLTTLKRAFSLMRRRAAPLLGLYVGCAVIGAIVSGSLTAIPSTVALIVGTRYAWPLVTVGSIIGTSLIAPFNGAAMTLMYHDIRFRTEGLDLRRRADRIFPQSDSLRFDGAPSGGSPSAPTHSVGETVGG